VETVEQLKLLKSPDSPNERVKVILNAGRIEKIAPILVELESLGVQEVLVEGLFDEPDGPERVLAIARTAVA
jgi:hypothetical protein